ncbi:prepilin peptidase [Arthrobacter citreus]|nr:prepilin peptidase [Arthrobacter citreus]
MVNISINYLSFFLLGLVFGSFFNVVGVRVPLGKSMISPCSSCPNCSHKLGAVELIPVLFFLFQRGRCKSCKLPISRMYILIELLTGSLFVLAIHEIGFHKELIISLSLIALLMIIVVSDSRFMMIPNRILLFFLFLFILERIFIPLDSWWSSVIGAVGAFIVMLLISIISKGGMGGGDIKLFGVLGIILGWKLTLITFMLSCFLGSMFGILLIMKDRSKKRSPIPFGPFIAAGGIVSYFYSEKLLEIYLSIFG